MAGVSGALAELLPPPGGGLCVHAAGRDHTPDDVRARAAAIAAALAEVGVAPSAPVGVLLANGVDLVAALFAVWQVGGVLVPLNHRSTDGELGAVVAEVDPVAIVTSPGHAHRLVGRPTVVVDDGAASVRHGTIGSRTMADGVAIVSFTSGTTGRPRPVPLAHARVLALLDKVIGALRVQPSGAPPMPNLIPVPLTLWAGIYQVLFAFRVGAAVVVMERFDTREFARLVRRFGIRSTVLPPAAMVMLSDDEAVDDLAPLKYVRSVSSPLSPLQARRFRSRFGIGVLNCYGQTELGGEVVGWTAADVRVHGDDKLGSVGRPHAGVEVRTDDAGELWVRTPELVQHADLGDRLDADGWLRTGDVARIDDEGFVWIEGRVSEMVNRGGLKVHPSEVEEVLRLSPGVADAAVAGMPDDRLGEVPWAWCVPADPAAGLPPVAVLEALCREHLSPYKVPARFVPVPELPRNEVGKVLKRTLAARR